MRTRLQDRDGFSLIETIVYITLTVTVLVVGMNLLFTILGTREETRPRQIVENESYFVLEKVGSYVRAADAIVSTSSTSTLVLEMADSEINPTQFTLRENKVAIKQGDDPWRFITSDEVEVLELKFENLTPPDSPGVVRLTLHLKPIPALGGRPEIEVKTTAMVRE